MFPTLKSIPGKVNISSFFNVIPTSFVFTSKNLLHTLKLNKTDNQNAIGDQREEIPSVQQTISPKIENPYYIENGLRKVYPYYFQHNVFCKGRWFGRTLLNVYSEEFLYPKEHIEQRILSGALKVNGETVPLDYKLKCSDLLTSNTHRHELPVLATPIKTIFEDDKLFVIDKPPSIPVHPSGLYRYNTLIFMLDEEQKSNNMFLLYRLDRLTSGVFIMAKDKATSRQLHDEILSRNVQKEYLCRVEGEFPDGDIVCDKPIKQFHKKIGISIVDTDGKPSLTEFKKLSYNGKSSVVVCRPKTGRTHQIRVHLQYLGYPIVNDPLYNCYAFGPNKGKHGHIGKSYNDLLSDLVIKHSASWWLVKGDNKNHKPNVSYSKDVDEHLKLDLHYRMLLSSSDVYSSMHYGEVPKTLQDTVYKKNAERITYDEKCYFCSKTYRDPAPSNLVMFLHAYKYRGSNWEFSTEIPPWAESQWDIL